MEGGGGGVSRSRNWIGDSLSNFRWRSTIWSVDWARRERGSLRNKRGTSYRSKIKRPSLIPSLGSIGEGRKRSRSRDRDRRDIDPDAEASFACSSCSPWCLLQGRRCSRGRRKTATSSRRMRKRRMEMEIG
ncbi:hypothetical protein PENTCL1PPCAC_13025 [Pristionchus entomophagus]|uniref:Uncharacterized protein n=1 Tax=Pristionchus entomophagus TaxID=358040 RepID=A0AAV5T6V7_9BILA|nr:hypothetical protein PENTCL1PPCAC_13025 [Pristionchus entomophagus]